MTQSRRTGPPARIIAAAALCGALALPMLAAAGSLVAHATSGDGPASAVSGVLTIAVLGTAGLNLYGAFLLVQRGAPRHAQLGGYLTIGITAVMLTGLIMGQSRGVAVMVSVIFLGPAIVMLTLLGTRHARRWMAARSRSWRTVREQSVPAGERY